MAAALDDLAGLDHQDQICVLDRAQAVCDDDAGASTQQPAERYLDPLLGARVDAAGRLVEDQDARVNEHRARERQQLALSLAQRAALFSEARVVALRQRLDEGVSVDRLGGGPDLGGRGAWPAVGDVVGDGPAEQES